MKDTNKIDPSQYTAHLHPGKFQDETAATEHFYNEMLNGDGDAIFGENDEEIAQLFHITSEEADAFNLTTGHWFLLWESNDGFAFGETYPTRSEATSAFHSKQ